MKKLLTVILCLLFAVTICGCAPKEEVKPNEDIIINLPTDNTVNGYREENAETETSKPSSSESNYADTDIQYCANTNSKVFHRPDCSSVKTIKEENKLYLSDRQELIDLGYNPCKRCEP